LCEFKSKKHDNGQCTNAANCNTYEEFVLRHVPGFDEAVMAALPLLRPRPRGRVLGLRPVAVPAPARPAHVRVEAVRADRVHFSESWQPFRFLHYEHFCH
jgi:hypothetical protein